MGIVDASICGCYVLFFNCPCNRAAKPPADTLKQDLKTSAILWLMSGLELKPTRTNGLHGPDQAETIDNGNNNNTNNNNNENYCHYLHLYVKYQRGIRPYSTLSPSRFVHTHNLPVCNSIGRIPARLQCKWGHRLNHPAVPE